MNYNDYNNNDYNNEYQDDNGYSYNDYNNYNENFDNYNYNDDDDNNKKKSKFPMILIVLIIIALVGGIGFYSWKTISSKINDKPAITEENDDPTQEGSNNNDNSSNGNADNNSTEENEEEGEQTEEESNGSTDNSANEEKVVIGGVEYIGTSQEEINKIKSDKKQEVNEVMTNFFKNLVISDKQKDKDIENIKANIKILLDGYNPSVSANSNGSKVTFKVSVSEFSYSDTYTVEVVSVDQISEQQSKEDAKKQEEFMKNNP